MPEVTLTPEQIQGLKDLADVHKNLSSEIERAKAAGLDMSEYESKYQQLETLRQGLLKVYGTTSRRKLVS